MDYINEVKQQRESLALSLKEIDATLAGLVAKRHAVGGALQMCDILIGKFSEQSPAPSEATLT